MLLINSYIVKSNNFTITYGDIIKFDHNRIYGYNFYVAGNFTIDLSGANTSAEVILYHRDGYEPIFNTGLTVIKTGDYVPGVLNIIKLTYNGSQIIEAIHAQI
jgi:hypothetical protein